MTAQHHVTVFLELNTDAADEIGCALNARETVIDFRGIAQVVDKHHGLGALGAGIVADRGALPEDRVSAGILGVERAFAIAQSERRMRRPRPARGCSRWAVPGS